MLLAPSSFLFRVPFVAMPFALVTGSMASAPFVASLLLVARPGAPNVALLLLVAMPFFPSSVCSSFVPVVSV